jgi:hypothetical protein
MALKYESREAAYFGLWNCRHSAFFREFDRSRRENVLATALVCTALAIATTERSHADGVAFTAEGQLTYKVLFVNPDKPFIIENTFRVTVANDRWLVQLTPRVTNALTGTKSLFVGTDGTNVYQITSLNPEFDPQVPERASLLSNYDDYLAKLPASNDFRVSPKAEGEIDQRNMNRSKSKTPGKPMKPPWNEATAVVWPGVVPRVGRDFFDIVWLALASHNYLRGVTNDHLPAVGIPRSAGSSASTNRSERAEWTLLDGFPGLPYSVRYFNNGYREIDERGSVPVRHPPPFDRGYVRAEYQVHELTNIAGWVLPRTFSYLRFSPRLGAGSSNELNVACVWEGEITGFHVMENAVETIPQVTQKTAVADYRVSIGVNAVAGSYPMKAGDRWSAIEEIKQMPEIILQREIEQRRHLPRSIAKRNRVLAGILFLNLAVGGVLVVLWRKAYFKRTP